MDHFVPDSHHTSKGDFHFWTIVTSIAFGAAGDHVPNAIPIAFGVVRDHVLRGMGVSKGAR